MNKRKTNIKSTINKKTNPKKIIKSASKNQHHNKQPQYFIFLDDNIYIASSKTQRQTYNNFEQEIKQHRSHTIQTTPKTTQGQLQNYLHSLSRQQKIKLMQELQKDIHVEQPIATPELTERHQKLSKLQTKLQSIKNQLSSNWQQQIDQINYMFERGEISLEDKNEKIMLIEKIKANKVAMIDCTKVLFHKILSDQNGENQIDNIITSLNSFSSLEEQHHKMPIEKEKELIISIDKSNKEEQEQILVQTHPIQLHLDLRLDEVQLGKDHYDDEDIGVKDAQSLLKDDNPQSVIVKPQIIKIAQTDNQLTQIVLKQKQDKSNCEQFLCNEQKIDNKLKIPLIMTKDRLQQIQNDRIKNQIETLLNNIKNRLSFQSGDLFHPQPHFTTLVDINHFVISFYQYLMTQHLTQLINDMNLPYGNSSIDKLYAIQTEGYVRDPGVNQNVLREEYLHQFHRIISLVRPVSQHQKYHQLAIFHCFNGGLNVYRPYYELDGEVFPWIRSQKGLTFYEINEDNIEQVFQKSKLKALEYCSCLCGLLPDGNYGEQSNKLLLKRREQFYERTLKNELIEKYNEWNVKMVNFETLTKILVNNTIEELLMKEMAEEISRFKYKN